MSSLRNDAFDMTILPKSALRRKRAGKENSESSVGLFFAGVYFLKVFMACGTYAIPAAIVIGNFVSTVVSILYNYLIFSLCLFILITNGQGSASYPEFVKSTFDGGVSCFPKASKFFEILVMVLGFIFSFCLCSLYMSFIAIHICHIIDVNLSDNVYYAVIILVAIILLIFLSFVPIWAPFGLYILALIGLICQVLAIILGFIHLSDKGISSNRDESRWANVYWAASIIIYIGEGINSVFPLVAAMKKPDTFLGCPSLLCVGMTTLVIFTLIVAIASARQIFYSVIFIVFLPKTTSTFGQIIKILAAASLLCTYPIQLEAAYRCAVEQLKKEEKDAIKYGVRALLVVLSSIFVFFVHPDRMIFFMGIIGSICLTFLMYIVPGLVPFCTENYGKLYWMGIVGILAMLTGTVIFIGGILENSRNCDQMEFLGFSFDAYC